MKVVLLCFLRGVVRQPVLGVSLARDFRRLKRSRRLLQGNRVLTAEDF